MKKIALLVSASLVATGFYAAGSAKAVDHSRASSKLAQVRVLSAADASRGLLHLAAEAHGTGLHPSVIRQMTQFTRKAEGETRSLIRPDTAVLQRITAALPQSVRAAQYLAAAVGRNRTAVAGVSIADDRVRFTVSSMRTPNSADTPARVQTFRLVGVLDRSHGIYSMVGHTANGQVFKRSVQMSAMSTCAPAAGGTTCSAIASGVGVFITLACGTGIGCIFGAFAGGFVADQACNGNCSSIVRTSNHTCSLNSCTADADAVGLGTFATSIRFDYFFYDTNGDTYGWFVKGVHEPTKDGFGTTHFYATATPNYARTCHTEIVEIWYEVNYADGSKAVVTKSPGEPFTKPNNC